MKFFVPAAQDTAQAKRVYDAIREFNSASRPLTDHRIFSLKWVHEGKTYYAEVGKRETRTGELILAILEATQLFYVCGVNRGAVRGEPILVGASTVKDFELFEQ